MNTIAIEKLVLDYKKQLENIRKELKTIKGSPFKSVTNVHSTTDYHLISYVDSNRPLQEHYKGISKSISKYGFLTVGLVAQIKEGRKIKFYLLDGQHRFECCKASGIPFEFKLIEVESKAELLPIITALNSTSKPWNFKMYLKGWSVEGKKDYIKLAKVKDEFKKISVSTLMNVFNINRQIFEAGNWKAEDFTKGVKLVNQLNDILPIMYASGKINAQPLRSVLWAMNQPSYNHKKMLRIIENNKNWSSDEKELKFELNQAMRIVQKNIV